jgi:hypothetical protein
MKENYQSSKIQIFLLKIPTRGGLVAFKSDFYCFLTINCVKKGCGGVWGPDWLDVFLLVALREKFSFSIRTWDYCEYDFCRHKTGRRL